MVDGCSGTWWTPPRGEEGWMPWEEMSVMTLRKEFVELATKEKKNRRELIRRYSITPASGYKWLNRFKESGEAGLVDKSRRPHSSPLKTASKIEAAVLAVRDELPAWGGRKIRQRLKDLGHEKVPAASTITAIVRRSG